MLVVDANILFAALIKDSATRRFLIGSDTRFAAPEYILEEIERHKKDIRSKGNLTDEDVETLLDAIWSVIELYEQSEYAIKQYMAPSTHLLERAEEGVSVASAVDFLLSRRVSFSGRYVPLKRRAGSEAAVSPAT